MFCRVTPGLAAVVAERVFVTPGAPRQPRRELEWATRAAAAVVESDAGDLATWTWGGDGPTALLVHGWAGRGLQLGSFAEDLVARGWRVVAYDAPGHGRSKGRTSSLIEIARGVGAMSRMLAGVEAVVAHSLGATATVLAAGRGELQARRVALLAPSASLAAIVSRFGGMTGFPPAVLDRMRRRLAIRLHFDWEAAEPLAIAPRMSTSALVVHDRGDRFVPFGEGRDLADAWPDARLIGTEGLGHHRLLRAPEVVASVCDFITEDGAGSASGHHQRLTA